MSCESGGEYVLKDFSVVPVPAAPVALDPSTFLPSKGILTRYSKKLLQQGAKYYSTVNLGDYNEPRETPGEPGPKRKYRSIDDPWEPC